MLHNSVKMLEAVLPSGAPRKCSGVKCGKPISAMDRYWLDLISENMYCYQCGLCLRYARKKALQRGETLESAGD